MKNYIDILKCLISIPSVSGFEKDAADSVMEIASEIGFETTKCDRLGNVVLQKSAGKKNTPSIVLDAHMDEIGFRVRSILDNGFIEAVPVGGIDPIILRSAEVTVHGKEKLLGILSLPEGGEGGKPKTVYVDTLYSSERLRSIVNAGDAVTFYSPVTQLHGDRLIGHAFDDKALAAVLLTAVSQIPSDLLAFNVYVTLSSREEVGGGGAACAAADISPVAAIVTDVNFATTPGVEDDESGVLGRGPMVSISAVTDRKLTDSIISLASENGIRTSPVVESSNTGTNASLLYIAGGGIPCAVVSLPEAGMHTFSECISLNDVHSLISLIKVILTSATLASRLREREVTLDV